MGKGYEPGKVALMSLLLFAAACTASRETTQPVATTASASPMIDLAAAEAAWQAAAIQDYTLTVQVTGCFACGTPLTTSTTVRDGQISEATVPEGMKERAAPTVEDLFDWLESYGADASRVRYNDVGVPLRMHLDHPDVSDDEGDFTITFTELST